MPLGMTPSIHKYLYVLPVAFFLSLCSVGQQQRLSTPSQGGSVCTGRAVPQDIDRTSATQSDSFCSALCLFGAQQCATEPQNSALEPPLAPPSRGVQSPWLPVRVYTDREVGVAGGFSQEEVFLSFPVPLWSLQTLQASLTPPRLAFLQ